MTGAPANAKPSTSPSETSISPLAVSSPATMPVTVSPVAAPFRVMAAPATAPSRSFVSSVMVSDIKPNPMVSVFWISTAASSSITAPPPGNGLSPPTATRVPAGIPAAPFTRTPSVMPVASPTVTRVVVFVPAKLNSIKSFSSTVISPERRTVFATRSIPPAATVSPVATPFTVTAAPTVGKPASSIRM